MTKTELPISHRYRCLNTISVHCDRAEGKPRTKKCRYCGSGFLVLTGTWIAVPWRGDGRYRAEDAVKVFRSVSTADRYVDNHEDETLVVRFV